MMVYCEGGYLALGVMKLKVEHVGEDRSRGDADRPFVV